jgi:soluble lytic murein transglycosylase-like protein
MPSEVLDPVAATESGHPAVDQWNAVFNDVAAWSVTNADAPVPPNLLKAICEYESGGDATIVGQTQPPGIGLMQITTGAYQSNGEWLYSFQGQAVPLVDPWWNVKIAAHDFIAPAILAFPGYLDAVIAAYNAGVSAVEQAVADGRGPSSVTYNPDYVTNVRNAFAFYCGNAHEVLGTTA